jgi:hypothetical protein
MDKISQSFLRDTAIMPMANEVLFNTKKILTFEKDVYSANKRVPPTSKSLQSSYSLNVKGYLIS